MLKYLFHYTISINYLQVIDLISQRGVFSLQNISSPIDHFYSYLSDFRKYPDHHFNTIFWQNHFAVWRAEILTQFGFCYTFNIVEEEALLNLEEVSEDFRYKHKILINRKETVTEFQAPLRTNHKDYGAFFFLDQYAKEHDGRNVSWILNDFDGFLMLVHDPYELPSENALKIYAQSGESVDVMVTPESIVMDESLYDLEFEE